MHWKVPCPSVRFSIAQIFMIFTPWSLSGLVTLGLKCKLVPFNFEGTRHHCISSWRVHSVHESVPDAHAQCTHQFLTRMLSMSWRPFLNLEFFTLMLSIRIGNWCVCSVYASVPDWYAQCTHQFLTSMLKVRTSHWCGCSACFEGTALLKIRLNKRVRHFTAPNEPLNICKIFFILIPKSPSWTYKSWESERSKISHLGTFKFNSAYSNINLKIRKFERHRSACWVYAKNLNLN